MHVLSVLLLPTLLISVVFMYNRCHWQHKFKMARILQNWELERYFMKKSLLRLSASKCLKMARRNFLLKFNFFL